MKNIYWILIIILLFTSCKKQKQNKHPVVQIGDNYLYLEDIQQVMPKDITGQDSIMFVQNYINKWINDHIFLQQAEKILGDKMDEIEKKVKDFRNSLIIYEVKQKYLQNLDSSISNELVNEYYQINKQNYLLNYPIIMGFVIKTPVNATQNANIKELATEDKPEITKIKELTTKANGQFIDFTQKWQNLNTIINLLPTEKTNKNYATTKIIEAKDTSNYYILRILDYKKPGDIMPLSYCYNDIVNLLKKRKEKLFLDSLTQKLYRQAKENGDLQFYQ